MVSQHLRGKGWVLTNGSLLFVPGRLHRPCKQNRDGAATEKREARQNNSLLRRTSCAKTHSFSRSHHSPLDACGLYPRRLTHSRRCTSDELGVFSRHFAWRQSGDQGETSRFRARQEWSEARSTFRLFSQILTGSYFSFSRFGSSYHGGHVLHFSSVWGAFPHQNCGTYPQQRSGCRQHSQAFGGRRFGDLSWRNHLPWAFPSTVLFPLRGADRPNHPSCHEQQYVYVSWHHCYRMEMHGSFLLPHEP